MNYVGVVLLVVILIVLTLPSYIKTEKRNIERWDQIKNNWKNETTENKLWLVGQYVLNILFILGLFLIAALFIKELYVCLAM
ncbi:hypothetical protein [Paenibacillus sp. SN-8-1]|uniref:hypothetical protein n=1 Tax=Paenibacillus sp. SN-8-1 TaxID=3435409 RepID=UPI003D9A3FE3